MPIYEYRCAACGHDLEALQKMSDPLLRKCPECGKSQLRRLVSAPQFRLKGSGWYETDFKNKDEKKRNLVDKPGAADGEAKSAAPAAVAGAKPEAGKAVAADKADGAATKVDKPRPSPEKAGKAARKKASAKPRAAST